MTRALVFFLACVLTLLGCSVQRTICPAYQSAFIFDKSVEKSTFVLYNENKDQPQEVLASNSKTLNLPPRDSSWDNSVVIKAPALPQERRVKKGRYLLLPPKTYKKALRALQTVAMKPVYPKKESDSLDIKKALDSAARSITDTITSAEVEKSNEPAEDSVYMISKAKEKFNLDQDNYMWYFRDILVLPDVRLAMEGGEAEKNAEASGSKTRQNFFKKLFNIFKKKPNPDQDSTTISEPVQEIDSSDSTSVTTQPVLKKKKGLGGLFKRKAKTSPPPAKKEEGKKEEDDGF